MTLATICQDALYEIGGFEVPSSFYGSTNQTALQCVALVKAAGKSLVRDNNLAALITDYTFSTVAGTANYDLPAGFKAFANMSQWNRTTTLPVFGPTSGANWQYLKSSIANGTTITQFFRIAGSYFSIHPTPTATETIAFDYYSKYWVVTQSSGDFTDTFASDNDTCRIDEYLLTKDLKWRFLQAKGMPFEAEYREWESLKDQYLADDGGKGVICLSPNPRPMLGNIPDTNFGL